MSHKVAVVCDPGIDGAFAVALALHDPALDVVGLLATAGNVSADPSVGAHTLAFFPCNSTGGLSTPAIATQVSGSTILAWVGRGIENNFSNAVPFDNQSNNYALVGAIPTWPHSKGWGYGPSGGLGLVVLVLIILLLMGRI